MQEPSDQPETLRSMTGGGFYFDDDGGRIWTLADTRRLIDALGGPIAAAATMVGKSGKPMDRRTMQRIYAGKLPASPTLRRQLADRVESTDGKA